MPISRCGIDEQRGDLLSELTTGFEALLEKVEELAERNAEFERQIKTYRHEGRAQFTPTKESFTSSDIPDVETETRDAHHNLQGDERIAKGIQAWELLRMSMTGTVPLRRTRWRRLLPDKTLTNQRVGLERDFTTHGTQGELKCPFSAQMPEIGQPHHLNAVHPKLSRPADPEPTSAVASYSAGCARSQSRSLSNKESLPQCPIRFLDQIPAEEVAKYFEEHKHEIPRSHEVCVKRYQANEASIRSLDAKYGNLVNMIQGLGHKHQPMLPLSHGVEDEGEHVELDKKSIEKIGIWAENCAEGPAPDDCIDTDDKTEARTGHFDRPLAEVRLGESPSRPWGVRVPDTTRTATRTNLPEKESVAAPVQPRTHADSVLDTLSKGAAGKCPFGHGAIPQHSEIKSVPGRESHETSEIPENPLSQGTQRDSQNASEKGRVDGDAHGGLQHIITFTGPVFFGYSAEDAAALMRSFSQL